MNDEYTVYKLNQEITDQQYYNLNHEVLPVSVKKINMYTFNLDKLREQHQSFSISFDINDKVVVYPKHIVEDKQLVTKDSAISISYDSKHNVVLYSNAWINKVEEKAKEVNKYNWTPDKKPTVYTKKQIAAAKRKRIKGRFVQTST